MKKIALIFIFCSILVKAYSQANLYHQAIDKGDSVFRKGEYKNAINFYFAAAAYMPAEKSGVKEKVNKVFDKVETLKIEAIKSRNEADLAKTKALKSDSATKVALAQSQKLINVFYFYKGRFALAFKNSQFYFIDKTASDVSKLGRWKKAEQFNENDGFARVIDNNGSNFIIDTLGKEYKVAYDIRDIDSSIRAIDFSGKHFDSLPAGVFKNKKLEVLILSSNNLKTIPPEIGELKNLASLYLFYNRLESLSEEIVKLNNLTYLLLTGNNNLPQNEIEKIKEHLPNCKIIKEDK